MECRFEPQRPRPNRRLSDLAVGTSGNVVSRLVTRTREKNASLQELRDEANYQLRQDVFVMPRVVCCKCGREQSYDEVSHSVGR